MPDSLIDETVEPLAAGLQLASDIVLREGMDIASLGVA